MHPRAASLGIALSIVIACPFVRAQDLSFDYTSFGSTFGQAQLDVLNYPGINGRYMMTSGDNHRPEMVANGNQLAGFYNFLTDRYSAHAVKDGNVSADEINAYFIANAANNGPKPTWLVLNEISSSLWSANPGDPSLSTYRTWLIDCVSRLTSHYGYKVVTLAPFQNPGQNNASWQALSAIPNNYVGIECYLSGTEVWNSGNDYASRLAWAQQQYQASKNSYIARGVPASKLFVTEHFANNDATFTDGQGNVLQTGWGRAGLASASDWDTVIQIRQDAIYNVGFDGFLAYNWGGNGMGVTLAEQLQHEYVYRSRLVLRSQQPQWLTDAAIDFNGTTIPLSWSQPLNWLGGVPNATGAVANFYRTNTAARTVTLDGTRTVGTLTFNSPASYTIAAGTGGSIVLDNTTGNAIVSVAQGSHTISTGLQLLDTADLSIDAGTLTITGAISGGGGITKNGPGTLALTNGASSYTGITAINGGVITVTSDTCLGQVPSITTSDAITLNGGSWRNVGGSAITIPATRGITVLAGGGTLDFSSTAGVPALNAKVSGTGTLTKMGIRTLGVTSDSSATFSGDWLVKQGRLNVNAGGTVNALGSGTITLAPGSGDVAQLGIGLSTGGIVAELANPIVVSPTGNGQVSFEVNAGNTLTLSGNISGAGGVQKSGGSASGAQGGNPLVTTGTLILTGNNTYTGGTTVNAGTLAVKRLHEDNAVNVAGGTLQVLQRAPGASIVASRPSSLSIANDGAPLGSRTYNATLDLTNNDLILDYAPGNSLATSIEDMVRAGFHGGDWLAAGIVSSTAGDNDWIYTLGVADNAQLGLSSFGGHSGLSGNQVLVRYTIFGDAELSGSVNAADFARFRAGFANEMPDAWLFGDFNYSGTVDAADFNLFLFGFHNQPGSTLSPQFAGEMITFAMANGLDYTPVPEPAGLAFFAIVATCLARRPRRSHA